MKKIVNNCNARGVPLCGKRRVIKALAKTYATAKFKIRRAQARTSAWTFKYKGVIAVTVTLALVASSTCLLPSIQEAVESYLSASKIPDLRSLLESIGAALIGATAIAFSLMMFAMQVNVERMPHGLFFKFSSDRLILAFFGATFLLAIAIACSSLFIGDLSQVGIVLLCAFWAVAAIPFLVVLAFRRALFLINPVKQLDSIIRDAHRQLRIEARYADLAKPLLEIHQDDKQRGYDPFEAEHDIPRATYFLLNPSWADGAKREIDHCISFAHRNAVQGDYQVSGVALEAVAAINTYYVEARGKKFFTPNPFLAITITTDGLINETLEHLRRTTQIALKRSDERQMEQALDAFAKLVAVYVNINYSQSYASKMHAHLAARYLAEAVRSVVPRQMPDVLMEGIRLMGNSALLFLAKEKPDAIAPLVENIAEISCSGFNEALMPVTLAGMGEAAKLTIAVIQSEADDVLFALRLLRDKISRVAELFLCEVPDTPLSSIHSRYLAPFYGHISTNSFLSWLTTLTNQVLQADADHKPALTVIRHIETWADGLYDSQKNLLLRAVQKRSLFSLDVIHWITHITKLLLAISEAPACDGRTKGKIQEHARWLLCTLSWIPDDKETIEFVEGLQMTETLFESPRDAQQRGCLHFLNGTSTVLLLLWVFKAGKYETGWKILERGIYGLVALALMNGPRDENVQSLKHTLAEYLGRAHAPEQKIRDSTAREIRRYARTLHRHKHSLSRIEHDLSQLDEVRLRPVLDSIADMLSPDTAKEPVHSSPF